MRLFLLMLVVTAIEVVLIAKVGNQIGFFNTFLIIVFTAMLGSWQLKKQWRFVIQKQQIQRTAPSDTLIAGIVLLICAVLLITPGFLTDIVGFLGLIPALRERLIGFIKRHVNLQATHFFSHTAHAEIDDTGWGKSNPHQPHRGDRQQSNDILEGEYERKD
ncbi:FxsA family protein [Ostreibacterium oceani]|uniref:Uncharacterized protein n=1 Tax=Ostreibacterium oceani TaxID=2654998 RepID=A0A6N7F0L7_9GAMM|nr:FxsA family protein [Ostreibacterium oceani]MPV86328.1 hypothetical protein [Ostreibacterium oceani]